MQVVFQQVRRVAPTNTTVLLTGATGTGKELLARAVHTLSPRAEAAFIPINLSALPETLVESELFGHELGAFTGARSTRIGRVEAADGGTLFLDEVGDLRLDTQVKLLRVIEERQFERLGSNEPRQVDFRLVCATHRNLEEMVAEGTFREDLYYRLNVMRIKVPSLAERPDDIPLLAQHFLDHYAEQVNTDLQLSPAACEALRSHSWPGNVRELEHCIERAAVLCSDGDGVITPDLVWTRPRRASFKKYVEDFYSSGRGLREVLNDIERAIIVETLQRFEGNQKATAERLQIPRQTLQHRMKKLGL